MKRSTKYIEYDVEAAFHEQVSRIEEDQVQRLIDSGHAVYATKEILAGDQLEVEIFPEFTRKQQDLIPRDALQSRKDAQHHLDVKNSRKRCERKVNTNFGSGDIWSTFTYNPENNPSTIDEANRDAANFIRRLNYARKKHGLKKVEYIRVIEEGENGRFHHHMIIRGDMSLEIVESIWLKGQWNKVRRLRKDDDGLTGLARYITKESRLPGQKRWSCSKGLKEPEIIKSHTAFKKMDVIQMVRDQNQIEALMVRRYGSSYEFSRAEVRYNVYNGMYYITARLHRKPEPM